MRKVDELKSGCMAKAGDQEMTFVLLSRDPVAAATIRFWAEQRISAGLNLPHDPKINEAFQCAKTMEAEGKMHKP